MDYFLCILLHPRRTRETNHWRGKDRFGASGCKKWVHVCEFFVFHFSAWCPSDKHYGIFHSHTNTHTLSYTRRGRFAAGHLDISQTDVTEPAMVELGALKWKANRNCLLTLKWKNTTKGGFAARLNPSPAGLGLWTLGWSERLRPPVADFRREINDITSALGVQPHPRPPVSLC